MILTLTRPMQYAGEEVLASANTYAEAFAFRLLVRHLQSVSDKASNIDIMSHAGMCRNCLAKWYHAGTHASGQGVSYDEACRFVYGESYEDWKKKFQKPARPEQLELFKATMPWHAKHEKSVETWASQLIRTTQDQDVARPQILSATQSTSAEPCCYDDESPDFAPGVERSESATAAVKLNLGVLTISDRAAIGTYEDLSGPAVVSEARRHATVDNLTTAVVADDAEAIKATLLSWTRECNLVLTTGGTGFGPRDITPEATVAVLDKHAPGIIDIVHARALSETSHDDSLLSRAVAGVSGSCVVVNLPGRPEAARRNVSVLMPTLLKAVAMVSTPRESK